MQAKYDYTKLDKAVLQAIAASPKPLAKMGSAVSNVASRLVSGDLRDSAERVIDRRLQALRRAGKIRFDHQDRCWHSIPSADAGVAGADEKPAAAKKVPAKKVPAKKAR